MFLDNVQCSVYSTYFLELICLCFFFFLFLHFLKLEVGTYLLNFKTDSEFVKVVMYLRVLITKKNPQCENLSSTKDDRFVCLCVSVSYHLSASYLKMGKKLLQSHPNVRFSQVGMTATISQI